MFLIGAAAASTVWGVLFQFLGWQVLSRAEYVDLVVVDQAAARGVGELFLDIAPSRRERFATITAKLSADIVGLDSGEECDWTGGLLARRGSPNPHVAVYAELWQVPRWPDTSRLAPPESTLQSLRSWIGFPERTHVEDFDAMLERHELLRECYSGTAEPSTEGRVGPTPVESRVTCTARLPAGESLQLRLAYTECAAILRESEISADIRTNVKGLALR